MRWTPLLVAAVAAAPLAGQTASLDLAEVERRARPAPERLAADAELSAAAREISLSRSLASQGPTVAVEGGPRRAPEGDGEDLALTVDLPLAADGDARRGARDALDAARRELPAAAMLEAELALRLAYVEAWKAGETRRLGEREVETVSAWLAAARARVAEGAAAPYESALVAAEVGVVRLELAGRRERERIAWSELRARAELPEAPAPLAQPVATEAAATGTPRGPSLLARAAVARAALDRALVELGAARVASRWSVGGTVAQEGDEDVARLGLSYRFPLGGERDAAESARAAAAAERERRAELELAALEGRLAAACERLEAASVDALAPTEIERALAALDVRLAAGRDRPSEVLPLRRQLVGALSTEVESRAARLRAAYEIAALTAEAPR